LRELSETPAAKALHFKNHISGWPGALTAFMLWASRNILLDRSAFCAIGSNTCWFWGNPKRQQPKSHFYTYTHVDLFSDL
jgi:hypothetical protein